MESPDEPNFDELEEFSEIEFFWNKPDTEFFALGACHILAHVFLKMFPNEGYAPYLIKPSTDDAGIHVFVARPDGHAFDFRGYTTLDVILTARRESWGEHQLLDQVSSSFLLDFQANGLKSFEDFLHDPRPRAKQFIASLNK